MALDLDAVRRAYFAPTRDGAPEHPPTREELVVRHERRAVAACLAHDGDPVAEGLGEHGSLIGGTGKPLRMLGLEPEYAVPVEPMPLAWFDYPQAHARIGEPPRAGHPFLRMLAHAHLAGSPRRASPEQLARMLRAETLERADAFVLHEIFAAILPAELRGLCTREGMTLYEVARAIHLSGTRRARVVLWLHQFARAPDRTT